MKPRNSVYRILARCKAAKHGPTEKATRKRENEKVAKELDIRHTKRSKDMKEVFEIMYGEDW